MANKSAKKKAVKKRAVKARSVKRKLGGSATAAKRASKKRGLETGGAIQKRQWELPTSYCADGKGWATLREVVDPDVPTMTYSELSPDQRAELVAKRISEQPKFQIAMLGAGLLDQKRAMAEVKAQTAIGRALMEIEQRVINHQVNKAMVAEQPKPATRSKKKKPR
ncbi:MAG: hypothetical protein QOF62_3886 [Pyrinomonadaceae bacterium]|jgi:hypothetical protein|nr:hypothetical protein [Pyrinomonadaceae bacterium]